MSKADKREGEGHTSGVKVSISKNAETAGHQIKAIAERQMEMSTLREHQASKC